MSALQCPMPGRQAVLYANTHHQYSRRYEIFVEGKLGGERFLPHPVKQLKGLFWVRGSNSYCSFVAFCWAPPEAPGLLISIPPPLSTFYFPPFYRPSAFICLLCLVLPRRKVTHEGLMGINKQVELAFTNSLGELCSWERNGARWIKRKHLGFAAVPPKWQKSALKPSRPRLE